MTQTLTIEQPVVPRGRIPLNAVTAILLFGVCFWCLVCSLLNEDHIILYLQVQFLEIFSACAYRHVLICSLKDSRLEHNVPTLVKGSGFASGEGRQNPRKKSEFTESKYQEEHFQTHLYTMQFV